MTTILLTEQSKSSSVLDVCSLLTRLEGFAPKGSIVYVRNWNSGDVASATLIERSLSDGSKVYDILLNHVEIPAA